jgi:hypothetical protein
MRVFWTVTGATLAALAALITHSALSVSVRDDLNDK